MMFCAFQILDAALFTAVARVHKKINICTLEQQKYP